MQKCKEKKVLLIKLMRISVLQIIAVIMLSGVSYANPDFAQSIFNKRISVNLKNVTLKEALNNIKNKTEVKFVYSSTIIPLDSKVSFQANQEKLSVVLSHLLADLQITYTANDIGGYIILKKNSKWVFLCRMLN